MTETSENARVKNPGIIKIIGIGQSLRGDDAAGLEAVQVWNNTYPTRQAHPNISVELAELPGIGLLNLLEGCQAAILVDAVQSGAAPGKIHQLTEDDLAAFSEGSGSAHGWGIAETISLARQIMPDSLPGKLLVIGIEGSQFGLGAPMSPQVRTALPEVARLIDQATLTWLVGYQT